MFGDRRVEYAGRGIGDREVTGLTGDVDAYSLAEFCRRHGISLQLYYKLAQQGLAPATFYVGTRVLVSKESAARWRAEREAASAADVEPA